jgi:hypothetical protein
MRRISDWVLYHKSDKRGLVWPGRERENDEAFEPVPAFKSY